METGALHGDSGTNQENPSDQECLLENLAISAGPSSIISRPSTSRSVTYSAPAHHLGGSNVVDEPTQFDCPVLRPLHPPSTMVAGPDECHGRSPDRCYSPTGDNINRLIVSPLGSPSHFHREPLSASPNSQRLLGFRDGQSSHQLQELLAVHQALKSLFHYIKGMNVKVETDNKTVVSLINKQGTVRSSTLHNLTLDLLTWVSTKNLTLSAAYLPGSLNVIADLLSRPNQALPTEWSLRESTVNYLFHRWDRPHVDLFATNRNFRLQTYVSPLRDPQAFAVDALSIDWSGMFAYAFPPPVLLHKVVQKIHQHPCRMILVAPYWPRMLWFPSLVTLAVAEPVRLPEDQKLLSQVLGSGKLVFHPNPAILNLHAWLLYSHPSAQHVHSHE